LSIHVLHLSRSVVTPSELFAAVSLNSFKNSIRFLCVLFCVPVAFDNFY